MRSIMTDMINRRISRQDDGSPSSQLIRAVADRQLSPRKAATLVLETLSDDSSQA
jgi:hypothetical protein